MPLTDATPVSMTDILNLQAGIEAFTNPAEATAEVTAINAGTDTCAAYAARLAVANAGQSEAVMLTISLMQGGTPTAGKLLSPTSPANEFQHLTISYLPTQQDFAVKNNLPIIIYNAEVVALGTGAGGDGTQNNFLKNFGSSKLTLSQFETTLEALTLVSAKAIDDQYKFFLNLYGTSLPGGYPNADAAARAAAFGFAVGTDLANPGLNPTLISQLENALFLNAETINGDVSGAAGYQTNVAIGQPPQPKAAPLQGSKAPPPSTTNVFLTTGVDNQTQGFSASATLTPPLNGFVAMQNNTTFNGTVGGAGATWTAGDQVTAVAGTTGQTFNLTGIGAPGAINVTSVGPGNKVSNIQTVNITGAPSQAIQGDFTAAGPETEWTGLALLTVKSTQTATAADNLTVGPAVAVQVTDTVISAPPNLPLATGPFLTVNGGSTVTINENNGNIAGDKATAGSDLHSIIVNGGSGTKSVTITQTEDTINQNYARVMIKDVNGDSATAAGTITTVVLDGLAHFLGITKGPNMIVDNALTNLTVNNSEPTGQPAPSGTDLLIVNNMTTPTATTLNLSLSNDGVDAVGVGINFLVLTDVKNEYSTVHLSLGDKNSVLFFTDNGLATLDTTTPGTGALVASINDAPGVPPAQFPGGDGSMVPAGPSTIKDTFAGPVKIDLSGLNGPNNVIVDRGATVNNDTYTLGNFGTDNKGPTTSQSLMIKDTQLGNVDTINFGSGAYLITDAPHTAKHSYVNTAPDGAGLAAGLTAQQWAGISNTNLGDTLTFNGVTVQQIFNDGVKASIMAGITDALAHPQNTAAAFQVGANTFIFDHAGTSTINISPTDSLVALIGVAFNANTVTPGGVINLA